MGLIEYLCSKLGPRVGLQGVGCDAAPAAAPASGTAASKGIVGLIAYIFSRIGQGGGLAGSACRAAPGEATDCVRHPHICVGPGTGLWLQLLLLLLRLLLLLLPLLPHMQRGTTGEGGACTRANEEQLEMRLREHAGALGCSRVLATSATEW